MMAIWKDRIFYIENVSLSDLMPVCEWTLHSHQIACQNNFNVKFLIFQISAANDGNNIYRIFTYVNSTSESRNTIQNQTDSDLTNENSVTAFGHDGLCF